MKRVYTDRAVFTIDGERAHILETFGITVADLLTRLPHDVACASHIDQTPQIDRSAQ